MKPIGDSELILNPDGSVFHLHLLPENIADTIILVGDQDRVEVVSSFFEKIEYRQQNREFVTHTGIFNGKRLTVLSTGIGTDNIDIVVNELDALVNIDLATRTPKAVHRTLKFVRIGTSGALQPDIPIDTPVASAVSIGFDGLLNFYQGRDRVCDLAIEKQFVDHMSWNKQLAAPYFVSASESLLSRMKGMRIGMNISAPGFYGPQGRVLRLPIADPNINSKITAFESGGKKITNYEMESSAIYGLSALLGHEALTVCCIIANRFREEYSNDYKSAVYKLIEDVLNRLA